MIHLDHRDSRPIYIQIADAFRRQIEAGVLSPGDKLPSVRELSASLTINPNTIQKAYEALEAEGYVYSVPGKGSFAAPHAGVDTLRREQLLEQLDELVKELAYLGMSSHDICGHIRKKEDEPHD